MAVTINGTTGITTPDITTDSVTVDTTTLVVDETNNRVGIGTASPSKQLEVSGSDPRIQSTNTTGSVGTVMLSGGSEAYIGTVTGNPVKFLVNDSERGRFTTNNGGFFGVSNDGTYGSSFTTQNSHYIHGSFDDSALRINVTHATFGSNVFLANATRSATSSYTMFSAYSGDYSDREFQLRGDGNAYADASWNGGGADYAEYFEWSDGNTAEEDRRGYSVVLDGNQIRKATDSDNPSEIIGVISGNPSVVGDAAWNKWVGKYIKDDFGSYILDEDGHRTPNPDYDESQEYTPREDRPEWDAVGLMGKLRIRKGQPVGDRWIKMRDISETVEEWLVR